VQHQPIGRHPVPFRNHHQIAGDQVLARYFYHGALPDDQGLWTRQIFQRFQRLAGLAFLVPLDADHQKDEAHQHESFLQVAQYEIQAATGNQQQEHRFLEHPDQLTEPTSAFGIGQGVRAFQALFILDLFGR